MLHTAKVGYPSTAIEHHVAIVPLSASLGQLAACFHCLPFHMQPKKGLYAKRVISVCSEEQGVEECTAYTAMHACDTGEVRPGSGV